MLPGASGSHFARPCRRFATRTCLSRREPHGSISSAVRSMPRLRRTSARWRTARNNFVHHKWPEGRLNDGPQGRRHGRAHAIVEQVLADLKDNALAQLPSGSFLATAPGWCWPRSRPTSPCRRRPRVGLPRQSHHRNHPPATDRRPGRLRQVREATGHPPTQPLALAGQLGRILQRGLRATHPSNDRTTQPNRARPRTPWRIGQTCGHLTPSQQRPDQNRTLSAVPRTWSVDRGCTRAVPCASGMMGDCRSAAGPTIRGVEGGSAWMWS